MHPRAGRCWARLGAYVAVVALVGGLSIARAAHANLGEAALNLGRGLTHLGELDGKAHRVMLNGEAMYLAAGTIDGSLDEAQRRLRARCRESTGPVVQRRSDRHLMVACLVRSPGSNTTSMLERLRRFASTRDLGDLGVLRYGYARRTTAGRTHVVTVFTQGRFRLDRVLPRRRAEVHATEPRELPRPGESRRVLSARIEGAPHGLWMYESALSPESALLRYGRQLGAKGWTLVDGDRPASPRGRAYVRSQDTLVVSVAGAEAGSSLTVVLSRGDGILF